MCRKVSFSRLYKAVKKTEVWVRKEELSVLINEESFWQKDWLMALHFSWAQFKFLWYDFTKDLDASVTLNLYLVLLLI